MQMPLKVKVGIFAFKGLTDHPVVRLMALNSATQGFIAAPVMLRNAGKPNTLRGAC